MDMSGQFVEDCENNSESGVRRGLRDGVGVNSRDSFGRTGLHLACLKGHLSIVRILLTVPDIDVNSRNSYRSTGLYWACDGGHLSIVRILLAVPEIDVNIVNYAGVTPLMAACINTSESSGETVRALLQFPGLTSLNTRDECGNTAIMLAVFNGNWRAVEVLMQTPGLDMETGQEWGSLVDRAR